MTTHTSTAALTLCGVGLCMIGAAQLMQFGTHANAASAVPTASLAAMLGAAAHAQTGPTVVWYGSYGGNYNGLVGGTVLRAWSDGTVEMKKMSYFGGSSSEACNSTIPCSSPWLVISSPSSGFRAASDANADERVDGADLATLLSNWGDAPRVPFPPSDCPLDLINP